MGNLTKGQVSIGIVLTSVWAFCGLLIVWGTFTNNGLMVGIGVGLGVIIGLAVAFALAKG